MNLFESKSIYDAKTGKFQEEFYMNGDLVDCELYYFYLDREKDIEDKKLELENICHQKCEDCDGCCEECVNEDEIEVEYGEMLDIFVNKIRNSCHCPECIKEILDEFADVIIDNFDDDCEECENCYCDDESDTTSPLLVNIDEECIDCDDTECENQITSEELEELKLIASFTEEVLKRDGCPDCIFGLLGDLYVKGKNIGYKDCEDGMREFLG